MLPVRVFRLGDNQKRQTNYTSCDICFVCLGLENPWTYPQFSQDPDSVSTAVLYECPWDDFECIRDCPEWPAFDTSDTPRLGVKSDTDSHFCRTTSGSECGVEEDVTRDRHGVCEVTVDLVEDIF